MAIYTYTCIQCDKSIEVNRKMKDRESAPPCPSCGYNMIRAWDVPSVQFKGSGFYKTDNR